ncbi:MAG TPA: MFS transporter [Opitutaceae bacterium]|nr:MFS transporter [Opitutaceae bacterium]
MTAHPASAPIAPTAPEDRVPKVQKLGYGLGTFLDMWGHWLYPTLANQVFNIGLGVSPALVSSAIMLNRVFDAFSDPLFGWWSDNTRTRWGRRRPFMLVGSVVAGACLPLLFWVHPGWSQMHYFWFMVLTSAVYIPVMSCFFMPYVSLGAEMTPDYHERTSVMSYKYAVQKLPELGLFFAAQFTTLAVWVGANSSNAGARIRGLLRHRSAWAAAPAGTAPNILMGAEVYCMILGALMILAGVTLVLTVRERYYDKLVEGRQGRISLFKSLGQTVGCRPFRLLIGMRLAYGMGLSMVSTLGYYDTVYYVCHGDLGSGARWNFWMGVSGMILGFLGIPTFTAVARRLGKRHSMRTVMCIAIAAFVATWWLYDPARPWLQPLASGFIAFIGAGFWTLDGSMLADIIDYDELATGNRREGVFASAGSWIMKCGMALGAGAAGFILSGTGFDVALGGNQTAHSIFMIRLLLGVIPILGLLLSLLALARYTLSQEVMADIRRQLEARRGVV